MPIVPPSRSPLPRVVSRRVTLSGGLVCAVGIAATVSGCDLDELTSGAPSTSRHGGQAPDVDPDRAVVDGVLVHLDARLADVVALRSARTRLRRPLLPLEQMHRAHRAMLDPDGDALVAPTPSTSLPTRPALALSAVRTAEAAHQDALVTAAVAARSGALARLLASMSASVAQHLVLLPVEPAPGATR